MTHDPPGTLGQWRVFGGSVYRTLRTFRRKNGKRRTTRSIRIYDRLDDRSIMVLLARVSSGSAYVLQSKGSFWASTNQLRRIP